MGGTIELESQLNVGTTFTITIPFEIDASYEEREEEKREISEKELSGVKALLAEDNELNMDVMMPGMDGLTATREIRALPREDAKAVPIFAMTANAFADDIRQSKEAGMNEHLSKPLDEKDMMRVISRYVTGRRENADSVKR